MLTPACCHWRCVNSRRDRLLIFIAWRTMRSETPSKCSCDQDGSERLANASPRRYPGYVGRSSFELLYNRWWSRVSVGRTNEANCQSCVDFTQRRHVLQDQDTKLCLRHSFHGIKQSAGHTRPRKKHNTSFQHAMNMMNCDEIPKTRSRETATTVDQQDGIFGWLPAAMRSASTSASLFLSNICDAMLNT